MDGGPGPGRNLGSHSVGFTAPTEGLAPTGPTHLGDSGSDFWPPRLTPRSAIHRIDALLRFLGELERSTGRLSPVSIVANLPNLGPATRLRTWRARRPNFRFDQVDRLEVWKARALRDIDRSGRRNLPGAGIHGRSETSRSIRLFLGAYTESSGPFEWVASPGEVGTRDAGARLRYDLSVTGHVGFKKPPTVRSHVTVPPSPDPRAREMARVVLEKSLHVRPGEHVAVESWSETLEYAKAFVLEILRIGARPLLLYQDEPTYWAAVAESRPSNLARVGEHLRAAIAKSDALITFFGPSDRERFHALPSATMLRLSEYRDALYGAAARARTRAVQIALGRASQASARMYGVDLNAWKAELVEGTTVDPELLHARSRRIARALLSGRSIEITHSNGTRLRLGLRGRKPQVSDA